MPASFLSLSPRIQVVPVIHGRGDCALVVRKVLLEGNFDCLAVPLPPSFQPAVEQAIEFLPEVTVVAQPEVSMPFAREWSPDQDEREDAGTRAVCSYVPIDPCHLGQRYRSNTVSRLDAVARP